MTFPDLIPLNDLSRTPPEVMAKIKAAIERVLASGWFVMGPEHAGFETELATYLGVSETVLLGNGTDALELALAAVGVAEGDQVLTVANAGAYATVAVRLLGATAAYCDVSPDTLLMTGETFSAALEGLHALPKAVVVTHLFGAMAPVGEIAAIARSHGIVVVEDCAQSLGARQSGRMAGTFGDIAATSFYPTKNLAALGDGGAVFTNNTDLADSVRQMRQYGWEPKYHIVCDHGRNSKLDEMQAAVLRVRLPLLDSLNDRRREIHARYEQVSSLAARVVGSASESFIAHLAVVTAEDRDGVRAKLRDHGVNTDVHYPVPDHLQDFPSRKPAPVSLPATERTAQTVLSIPMFPELTDAEVERVCRALQSLEESRVSN
jgi:dTDP-3-amino-2,3,6-trideoxy-4-keto-D-glucose/dTDP-3-amino-3,4,6-trideoxy-alpha-D-glucose/dTDP-2,6-dideoxy-D-kanosamine transaminase